MFSLFLFSTFPYFSLYVYKENIYKYIYSFLFIYIYIYVYICIYNIKCILLYIYTCIYMLQKSLFWFLNVRHRDILIVSLIPFTFQCKKRMRESILNQIQRLCIIITKAAIIVPFKLLRSLDSLCFGPGKFFNEILIEIMVIHLKLCN
jgi:hypothetical protein